MAEPVILNIDVDGFVGKVLSLSEMPGEAVLAAIDGAGPEALMRTYQLFKLAVVNPKDRTQLDIITYGQIGRTISAWLNQSAEQSLVEFGYVSDDPDD